MVTQMMRNFGNLSGLRRWIVFGSLSSVLAGACLLTVMLATPAYACDAGGGGGGSDSNWNWNMNFNSNANFNSNSNGNSNSNSNSNSVELRG